MFRIARKLILGVILGCVLFAFLTSESELSVGMQFQISLFIISWGIGLVYSMQSYLHKLNKLLHPALKLSIISFLSFGNGFWGFMLLLIYLTYIVLLGWIYGWYLLIMDIASFLHN